MGRKRIERLNADQGRVGIELYPDQSQATNFASKHVIL